MSNEQTPTPMTAEEQKELDELEVKMKGEISAGKQITADDFKRYAYLVKKWRTSFVHVPSDPYWSDPATWPEWANWRAVGEDGCVYFSSILMEANTLYGSWSTSIYAASKMVPRAVNHNPNWSNSLRSREEVSGGK